MLVVGSTLRWLRLVAIESVLIFAHPPNMSYFICTRLYNFSAGTNKPCSSRLGCRRPAHSWVPQHFRCAHQVHPHLETSIHSATFLLSDNQSTPIRRTRLIPMLILSPPSPVPVILTTLTIIILPTPPITISPRFLLFIAMSMPVAFFTLTPRRVLPASKSTDQQTSCGT